MGVLNVTPDSFSDGGRYVNPDHALSHAAAMVADGAAIIDVGGESTRPGAAPVTEAEEIDRVMPVVERLAGEFDTPISVDTSSPTLMRLAVRAGAVLINDVRALQRDGAIAAAAAGNAAVCLMHMQGNPTSMQDRPVYIDPVAEIREFLQQRIADATAGGITENRLLVDPGFGFGKSLAHNVALLARLAEFGDLGRPLLVGLSRKSMLGALTGRDVTERLPAGVAAATVAMLHGACIVRAHDVAATVDAAKMVAAVLRASGDDA
ncbi:MAG: dihydropteroate synthase [Pseudomonadota bacterium]